MTDECFAEINAKHAWISKRSIEGARRWRQKLRDAMISLENNPHRCPLAPESEFYPNLRQLIFGKRKGRFRILFRIDDRMVTMLRVRRATQVFLKPEDFEEA